MEKMAGGGIYLEIDPMGFTNGFYVGGRKGMKHGNTWFFDLSDWKRVTCH
jgi:hypothetical protein